jgi:hypothetical protein
VASDRRESPLGFVKKNHFSLQSIMTHVKEKAIFFIKLVQPLTDMLATGSVASARFPLLYADLV